jgi:protein gp37
MFQDNEWWFEHHTIGKTFIHTFDLIPNILKIICKPENQKHIFIFLTKAPMNYKYNSYPSNVWIGTTLTSQEDLWRLSELEQINHPNKFISVEPLLDEIKLPETDIKWCALGLQTKGKKKDLPKQSVIHNTVASITIQGIPLFVKDNINQVIPLLKTSIKKYPESMLKHLGRL